MTRRADGCPPLSFPQFIFRLLRERGGGRNVRHDASVPHVQERQKSNANTCPFLWGEGLQNCSAACLEVRPCLFALHCLRERASLLSVCLSMTQNLHLIMTCGVIDSGSHRMEEKKCSK